MARDADLTTEEIRAAVLHLLQLAACYEGTPSDAEDDAAERTLTNVVDELMAHRNAHLDALYQGMAVALAAPLADLYRKFQADELATAFDLTEQVEQLFNAHGLGVNEHGLDVLVVDREEIVARRGPIQCAAETLARTMGIGSRSIFKRKAEGPALALTPTAFSRHVSKLGLLKYALSLFGPLDARDENAVCEWMHKRRLPET